MLAVVVIYGVSSAVDWTWFIPGVTVPALVCAGWLAARGPLSEAQTQAAAERTTQRLPLGRIATAIAVVAAALTRGDAPAALADARSAADSDPVSLDPLFALSAIDSALGNRAASRAELVKATQLQPSNALTWQVLGSYDLKARHPDLAVPELQRAASLDRTSAVAGKLLGKAQTELG